MKLNVNLNLWVVVAVIAATLFFFRGNKMSNDAERWENNNSVTASQFANYKSEVDGVLVSTKNSLEVTKIELKALIESDSINKELLKKYSKPKQVIKVITEYVHDTVDFPVPIYIDKDTTLSFIDECVGLNLGVYNGLISINDVSIHNEYNIVNGARKNGFWSTEQAVDIRNTNPCVVTTGIQSYNVVIEKKWYNHPLTTFVVGFGTGYLINELKQ